MQHAMQEYTHHSVPISARKYANGVHNRKKWGIALTMQYHEKINVLCEWSALWASAIMHQQGATKVRFCGAGTNFMFLDSQISTTLSGENPLKLTLKEKTLTLSSQTHSTRCGPFHKLRLDRDWQLVPFELTEDLPSAITGRIVTKFLCPSFKKTRFSDLTQESDNLLFNLQRRALIPDSNETTDHWQVMIEQIRKDITDRETFWSKALRGTLSIHLVALGEQHERHPAWPRLTKLTTSVIKTTRQDLRDLLSRLHLQESDLQIIIGDKEVENHAIAWRSRGVRENQITPMNDFFEWAHNWGVEISGNRSLNNR